MLTPISRPLICLIALSLLLLATTACGQEEVPAVVEPPVSGECAGVMRTVISPYIIETKEDNLPTEETGSTKYDLPSRPEIGVLTERARAIRPKYEDMFWRQPNVWGVGIGMMYDERGEWTGKIGFLISVSEPVDENTLPPWDRIPACLEGVPVQFDVAPQPNFDDWVLPPEAADGGS